MYRLLLVGKRFDAVTRVAQLLERASAKRDPVGGQIIEVFEIGIVYLATLGGAPLHHRDDC
ncbi:hypothetical protein PHK61_31310 [Actinomycetospora lutea]|uniref:hypothetical protein n=1 Tax=Actinomycetospora lutea TaxID=663604 RepID=UPI002365DB1B|nr:hypothetical protein [Actinomycetospora lutea]MDD7942908.1 hypothetical protein [Actinomycetospora lutea]